MRHFRQVPDSRELASKSLFCTWRALRPAKTDTVQGEWDNRLEQEEDPLSCLNPAIPSRADQNRSSIGTWHSVSMLGLRMHRFWSKIRGIRSEGEESNHDQHVLVPKYEVRDEPVPAAAGSHNSADQQVRYVGFGIGGAGNIRR